MYHEIPNFHTSTMRAVEALLERHVPPSLAERKGLPSADEVRRLTQHWHRAKPAPVATAKPERLRKERPKRQIVACDQPPQTWAERVAAARKAVALVHSGVGLSAALQRCDLNSSYSLALRQCVAGQGEIVDAAKAGLAEVRGGRHHLTFARWFLGLQPINGADDPDNERLRKALRGVSISALSAASGLSFDGLSAFARGKTKRMKATTRARVWDALNSRN